MAVTHKKVSAIADEADPTQIRPSDWNEEHEGDHAEDHVLAVTGPHTGLLPWADLNKTGSSLADLETRTHASLSDAPASAHHSKYTDAEAVTAVEAEDPLNLAGDVFIANLKGLVIGHTAQVDFGATPEFQVLGTGTPDASMGFARFENNASGPDVRFLKSRGATIGANVIVQDNDTLGRFRFQGADGGDFNTTAAEVLGKVDGAPSLNDIPGRIVFRTRTAGGSLSEKMRLDNAGRLGIGGTPAASALLDLQSTVAALLPTRMTTTQRDALTAVNGMVLYNSTDGQMQGRVAGAWVDLGGSGGGQDLATDTLWAAAGDLVKGTGNNAADILSIGADHTILVSNGTAPSWSAAPPLANIADTGDTNRIGLATSDPHITLTGAVTLPLADDTSGIHRQLRIAPTISSNTGSWRAIDIAPNVTLGGNTRSVYGLIGSATVPASSASTGQLVVGLFFGVAPETIAVSATFSRARGVDAGVNAVALSSGTLTVTEATALYGRIQTTESGSASAEITEGNGLFIDSPTGVGVITTYHGIRVADATIGGITNNRLLEIGPTPTPYLRLEGNFTAAANKTALSLSEGATPTLRELKSTDMAFYSVTSDDTSTASSASYDIWDQDSYPSATLNTTDNVTAKNITYTKSNGRFTVDVGGIFEITIDLLLENSSTTATVLVDIQDNGVSFWSHDFHVHSSVDPLMRSITVIRSLSAADYINVLVDGVTNVTVHDGTTISIRKIADITDDKVATFAN